MKYINKKKKKEKEKKRGLPFVVAAIAIVVIVKVVDAVAVRGCHRQPWGFPGKPMNRNCKL